ncbi:MAG TPA: 30S ribosomal protein S6 [Planctomycetota bacterium]|nr:30S ribosomal protein S6 [Planctomycetota bacterium]
MRPKTYEAMILIDNREVKKDGAALEQKVNVILEKHGAKILVARRWDERKLAYEIRGQKRATYYLAYYEASPDRIDPILHDLHLTESVLRVLTLAVLEVPPSAFEAPPPAHGEEGEAPETPAAPKAEEPVAAAAEAEETPA